MVKKYELNAMHVYNKAVGEAYCASGCRILN